MDFDTVLFAVGLPGMFVAGVLFHKYVVSETEKVKAHVTAEVAEVRADVASLLDKAKSKL
jgi:hypothetical protein